MKSKWLVVCLAFLLLVAMSGLAQDGSGTGPTAGMGRGTATLGAGGSHTPNNLPMTGENQNVFLDQRGHGGELVAGKVAVDGHPVVWDPIPVTIYCDGRAKAQTVADNRGQFSFRSVDLGGTVPQPKTADPNQSALYAGCTLRASLAGYRSSTITVPLRSALVDSPEVGTLHLTLDEHASGNAFSLTTATAPEKALSSYKKARDEYMEGRNDKAISDLQKAVQAYPQFAEAWYQLGKLQSSNNAARAKESYEKAIAADPKFVPPYEAMAQILTNEGQWQKAIENTSRSLQLDPEGSPAVWYYDALAKFNVGQRQQAEESAKKALAMDPNHRVPNTEQLLAVLEAGRGDLTDALEHLKHCLTYLPAGPNADLVKRQIAQLEANSPSAAK